MDIGLHGTKRMHVDSILRNGLFAGGDRGRKSRAHIHIVGGLDATGKRAGVRDGSDVVIRINTNRYYRDGGKCWWSVNDVLLTEGMWENHWYSAAVPPWGIQSEHRRGDTPTANTGHRPEGPSSRCEDRSGKRDLFGRGREDDAKHRV
jgi:hypothetical protein